MKKSFKKKTLIILTTLAIISFATYKTIKSLYFFEFTTFPKDLINSEFIKEKDYSPEKSILLLNTEECCLGGGEIHTFNLYKKMLKNGYNVSILIVKNSKLEDELKKARLPYYACSKFRIFKNVFQPGLFSAIKQIVKKENIAIIHSNIEREATVLKKAAKKLNVKIVSTRHIPYPIKDKYTAGLDGIIGVNPQITEYLKQENLNKNFGIKVIEFIPPFFDDEKFLNFKTHTPKKDFFRQNFNLELDDSLIICVIAMINENKNQALLLQAAAKLILEKHRKLQILLVGGGEIEKHKKLAENLGIKNYVHFLGFTYKVAEILYNSDINVLPSKQEAMSLSLSEAALMQKPLIGSNKTGMENLIKHEQTGLLFENNNLDSLVEQIEKLLNNPILCKKLGLNAYKFVKENFSTNGSLEKLEQFYKKVL